MNMTLNPKKATKILMMITAVLALADSAGNLLDHYFGSTFGLLFFDVDRERSIPTFYSAILLLTCALLLWIIFTVHRKRGENYLYWAGLSLIFLFLATDEAAALHENLINPLRNIFNTTGVLYYAWVIPYGILLLIFVGFYAKFLFSLPKETAVMFVISGAVFVTGAFGFELVSGYLVDATGTGSLLQSFLNLIEEVLEMIGSTLFIYTLLSYLANRFPDLRLSFSVDNVAKQEALKDNRLAKTTPVLSSKLPN